MKTKSEKRNQARKQAEAVKAARKAARQGKEKSVMQTTVGSKKGKSVIPQSKTKTRGK